MGRKRQRRETGEGWDMEKEGRDGNRGGRELRRWREAGRESGEERENLAPTVISKSRRLWMVLMLNYTVTITLLA